MKPRSFRGQTCLLAAAALLFPLAAAAQATAAPPGKPKPGNAAARQEGWPKRIPFGEATLVLEAPRAETLDGTKLTATSAVRMEGAESGTTEISSGTITFDADVEIDRAARTVTLTSVRVAKIDVGHMPPARKERFGARLTQVMGKMRPALPLDDVLADVRLARYRGHAPPKLNTEPPRILVEMEPAILIVFDGEPRFRAVEGSKLERAMNTPFLVLRDPGSSAYFLNGGASWFRAGDPKGPWAPARDVPREARQIAERDLKEGGVPDSEVQQASKSSETRVPKILVATEPTELIVFDGSPKWAPVSPGETSLETASNSDSDVFKTTPDGQYWMVLSGRWYRSGSLDGPWRFIEPASLPESFRRIPADSPRADALAFVPGTAAARDAVADASKPRTAAIRRADAKASVTWDGPPKFEEVAGTRVEYGVNTPEQVLKIHGRYYVVDQGVWFSAASPTGPWTVADAIPDDDIQAIPPESPVYNTRYALVYDATPETVYVAYTPGYLWSYPFGGAVVYGTGWAYRPWWGSYYYPRPFTWGFHPRYALAAGWGYGFSWGPGWGAWRYGFGWGWGARWCGPGAFFRPAWRNAAFARGVAARNLYAAGVNRGRAMATRSAAARSASAAAHGRQPGQKAQGGTAHGGAKSAEGKKGSAAGAHAGTAAPHGNAGAGKAPHGKAAGGGAHPGGGAHHGGGGKHH